MLITDPEQRARFRDWSCMLDQRTDRMKFLVPIAAWIAMNATTGLSLVVPLCRRPFVLPILLLLASISFNTMHYFGPGFADLWGLFTLIGFTHFTSLLYIKKWLINTVPPSGARLGVKDVLTRMYKISSNPRLVHISRDVVITRPGEVIRASAI